MMSRRLLIDFYVVASTLVLCQQLCLGQITTDTTNRVNLKLPPLTTHAATNMTANLATDQPIVTTQVFNDKIIPALNVTPIKVTFDDVYMPANLPIQISIIGLEPKYNRSALVYNWTTKEGQIKDLNTHDFSLVHKFTKLDEENFIRVTLLDPKTNATGEAQLNFIVKGPVVVPDPVGKLFLEKGELLDIDLIYSGSAPFNYCYKFCSPYDILPCNLCFPSYKTSETKVHIVHYLHYVGNYTLTFQISNIMNYEERHYTIKINNTAVKSNLPIAPIVSSILAVCILLSGVALHKRFSDTSFNTETANFDFFHDDEEEWERELSFIQRVRYLFYGSEDNDESRHLIHKSPPYTNATTTVDGIAKGAIEANGANESINRIVGYQL